MGVRHLYTFLIKNVKNGFIPLDIPNAVNDYKRKNGGRTPTIVIDLIMLHERVYLNTHELLLGGRYDLYNDRARKLFSKLKALGINLVFFVDGPTQEDKLETCLQRRNEQCEEVVKILHAIDDGLDISGDLSNFKLVSLSTFQNFIDIAQEFGEVYISVLNECDQEIVLMANLRNALAIITDDTDFLIFEGNWHHWSAKWIDFDKLITMEYNKDALRASLSLSAKQMIVLGSLAGNDLVPYKLLEVFHRRMSYRRNKFNGMADIVRKMRSLPPRLNYYDKNTLTNTIFHPDDRDYGMEVLQSSINFYCLENIRLKHENAILERAAQDIKRLNYVILSKCIYIFSFIYQDLAKNTFSSHFEIIKPILCRIMGVLLKNGSDKHTSREFYFKLDHNNPSELVSLTPHYPPYQVPSVMDLLYLPININSTLDELRWNLLCFIVSKKLNRTVLCQIPKENLGNVLTLFYLIEINEISVDEADCILLSCNVPSEIRDSLDFNEVKRIDGRDAKLAFLYAGIYNMIYNCISAAGFRDYCALLKFDGLCFHNLRKKWTHSNEKFKEEMLETIKSLRIYSKCFGLL